MESIGIKQIHLDSNIIYSHTISCFFSDIKKEINQTTDETNNPIAPPNKSVTISCNCFVYITFFY